ncbi:hypothetical protein DFH07DRAFT_779512 [Mycena maculata]|uniref:Uncharacterized protein n=1 Tax=Mycena maculata TaxID=230809 RepID=A0AAD7MXK9_9AGAR|nr:hypothetical protein DFH07DRAFT_779512 [Mycena maculata]
MIWCTVCPVHHFRPLSCLKIPGHEANSDQFLKTRTPTNAEILRREIEILQLQSQEEEFEGADDETIPQFIENLRDNAIRVWLSAVVAVPRDEHNYPHLEHVDQTLSASSTMMAAKFRYIHYKAEERWTISGPGVSSCEGRTSRQRRRQHSWPWRRHSAAIERVRGGDYELLATATCRATRTASQRGQGERRQTPSGGSSRFRRPAPGSLALSCELVAATPGAGAGMHRTLVEYLSKRGTPFPRLPQQAGRAPGTATYGTGMVSGTTQIVGLQLRAMDAYENNSPGGVIRT